MNTLNTNPEAKENVRHVLILLDRTQVTLALMKGCWRSAYCNLNKGECNLNQSKDDSFVKRVAKDNN